MNVPPYLLQFFGSLLAILALAGIARWLKLGGKSGLTGADAARAAANEAVDGFEASDIAIDKHGCGAILRDDGGRLLLLKPHGNKFAGRILTSIAHAQVKGGGLLVDSGERQFGSAVLDIDEPEAWAEAINRLRQHGNA